MFRWVILSITLHSLVLLILTDFLTSTVTSTQQGQLAAIEAILQPKADPLPTTTLDALSEVKPNRSQTRIAVPVSNVAKQTMEPSSLAPSESVSSAPSSASTPDISTGSGAIAEMQAKPQESISRDGLSEYRLNLSREARRYKRYPVFARQRGLEGVVVIVVGTSAALPVPQVSLSRSSGHDVLDLQAMDMLNLAVRAVNLPDSLRGRDFAINLPIHFSLEE
jgi:protein TonB